MAKRRKSSVLFSVESLREEAFAEGRNELIGSKILTDISSINLDQVEHVAEDVSDASQIQYRMSEKIYLAWDQKTGSVIN